jgi:NDP-sugar pyrophosphorylase family protein
MDAIILAGGMGTRLQSVVTDVPKPLAPVNGRPFMDIILSQLDSFRSFGKVVLAVGHKADMIESHYRNSVAFGFAMEFSSEATPLGTGGALIQALSRTSSQNVLLLNGDSYVEFDLGRLVERHTRHNAHVTMVVVAVEDTSRFGRVTLDASGSMVQGFTEKSGSAGPGYINGGCYLLARRYFEGGAVRPTSFERDMLPAHLGWTCAEPGTGRFIDIGVPESYSLAPEYLR